MLGRIVFLHHHAPPAWRARRPPPDKRADLSELNPMHDPAPHDDAACFAADLFRRDDRPQGALHTCTAGTGTGSGSGTGSAPVACPCMATRHLLVGDMEGQVAEMRRVVQRIELKMDEDFRRKWAARQVSGEWRYIALILDRLFFCVYLGLIVVSLCVLFPRSF